MGDGKARANSSALAWLILLDAAIPRGFAYGISVNVLGDVHRLGHGSSCFNW